MASTEPTFTTPNRPLTWLITGCSSGLGLAMVRHILAQGKGHIVIATSRTPSRTPELVAEVERQGGHWLALDITDPASDKVVAELEVGGTHIDVLINNAGAALLSPAEQFDDDEVRAQTELLYLGPYRLARAVLPHMRRRRFGIVVNVSSGAGLEGRESMGVYAAGKAALDGITKVLSKELAPFNVRVLFVSLGSFDTNMPGKLQTSRVPIDPDYRNSVSKAIEFLSPGRFVADGDPAKAVRVMYEVALGEGVGAGREGEMILPLGREIPKRIELVISRLQHTLEVFRDACNSVSKNS